MLEWIGWLATALFGASYLCKAPNVLRVLQAVAAVMWISYGVAIHALPVVVSSMIVAVMAIGSVWMQHRRQAAT